MAHEVIDLERRFWLAAGDPAFYRDHLAEEGRCVFGFGILDKAATMASIEGAEGWVDVRFEQLEVLELGADAVALTYLATAVDTAGDPYGAAVTSVYVRRDGAWALAIHQQSSRSGG